MNDDRKDPMEDAMEDAMVSATNDDRKDPMDGAMGDEPDDATGGEAGERAGPRPGGPGHGGGAAAAQGAVQSTVLRTHVQAEVRRLHSERRMGVIIGAVILGVVTIYMAWIDHQVSYWSRPENLVMAASGMVESNIPAAKRSAAALVRTEAPKLARYVGDTVSREVPLLMRNLVEETVNEYAGKLSRFAVLKYTEAFEAVIAGARGDLQQAVSTDVDDERDRHVVQAIEKQIETAMRNMSEGKLSDDPLFARIEQSHVALVNLNRRLQLMAAQDDEALGRRDRLTKRFLGTFWRFVQQENPDVKATTGGERGGKSRRPGR